MACRMASAGIGVNSTSPLEVYVLPTMGPISLNTSPLKTNVVACGAAFTRSQSKMEPQTLASLVADAMESHMSSMSAFISPLSLQGMTTSESEDDPMGMEEDTPKKKTKPTYYARRDEIRKLKDELGELTERMEQIQQIKQQDEDALMENAQLRDGLKQTDMTLAGIQSILADYRAAHARNPLEVKINLSANSAQRHQTLAALRDERLREATDFVLERVRFLDWRLPHRENESFELSNGDHVLLQCEVEPCRTDGTVKKVFDDVMLAIMQEEFSVWESLGVTTTFENDDAEDYTYSHARGISTMPDGAQFEKNMVFFRLYTDGNEEYEVPHGLVVLHPVAHDERYPFQPQLRVRQDMTMVIMVCPLPGGEGAVVIRWTHVLTPKPQCGITRLQEMRMRDTTARWSEVVRNNALEFMLGNGGET